MTLSENTSSASLALSNLPQADQDSLEQLEWPAVARILQQYCQTHTGQHYWQQPVFHTNAAIIRQHLQAVNLLRQWLERRDIPDMPAGISLPLPPLIPAPQLLQLGQSLTPQQLGQLAENLHVQLGWFKHLRQLYRDAGQPSWPHRCFTLDTQPLNPLADQLVAWFSPGGLVHDAASLKLAELRQSKRRIEDQRQALGQQLLNSLGRYLQERLLTERQGRMVLPVQAGFKSQIKGLVHDTSASGNTLFMEPEALIQLNNQHQQLSSDIEHAIETVCQQVSEQLTQHLDSLSELENAVGWLDGQLAASKFSRALDAHPTEPVEEPQAMNLKHLRHPLLVWEAYQQRQRGHMAPTIVSNNLTLGKAANAPQTLVITGPNTGGKSVLLKAAGLCAWMLRAGLHLPCSDDSAMSVFHHIGTVFGDAQNLSQSLSTFSGHIEQLAQWVQPHTDLSRTLLLIDEIASGTDPAEGAALAEALLKHVHQQGALTLVSTHLGILKRVAADVPGFANASVLFDVDTLSPTYQLAIGLPGASHALTIAQRYGIPETIIHSARQAAQQQAPAAEALMATLGEQQQHLHATEFTLSEREQALQDKEQQLAQQEIRLQNKKHEFTQHVQRRLRHQLQQLEADLNDTRKRLRKTDTESDLHHRERHAKRQSARAHRISEQAETLAEAIIQPLSISDVSVGMAVDSAQLAARGTITAIDEKKKRLTLDCNGLTVTVPLNDVVPVVEATTKKRKKPPKLDMLGRPVKSNTHKAGGPTESAPKPDPSQEYPTAECKLLGMTVEDGLQAAEAFLDESVLAGHRVVALIHGMGTGKLRSAIRQYLTQCPMVSDFAAAQAIHGGDGKTIVVLK